MICNVLLNLWLPMTKYHRNDDSERSYSSLSQHDEITMLVPPLSPPDVNKIVEITLPVEARS